MKSEDTEVLSSLSKLTFLYEISCSYLHCSCAFAVQLYNCGG